MHFTACAPKKYQPDPALVAQCQAIAARDRRDPRRFEEDPAVAAKGADVLYTDVWVSMGEPVEVWAERIDDLAAYQINQALMDDCRPPGRVHALPARLPRPQDHRGQGDGREVSAATPWK